MGAENVHFLEAEVNDSPDVFLIYGIPPPIVHSVCFLVPGNTPKRWLMSRKITRECIFNWVQKKLYYPVASFFGFFYNKLS